MKYRTRKMIAARDLNSNGTLFGGRVLDWIDEEAFIFASCQLESTSVVTRTMSEINFVATARQGEVIEIGMEVVSFGRTSITLHCEVRNRQSKKIITAVERIVFVLVDENGHPVPHRKIQAKISEDLMPAQQVSAVA
ncbi:MAG: acyl-CoA thioesterase [Proteobacteria bacterium]|nr:acyl-CoA thioesterase [Pseudomonadota bacterium]